MKRRTFLGALVLARPLATLTTWPWRSRLFVGVTPTPLAVSFSELPSSLNRYLYGRQWIDMNAALAPLNPPQCLTFPGGAFARAAGREMDGMLADLGRPRRHWYDGVHKGPRGQVRRAPGQLPKRERKAERRRTWQKHYPERRNGAASRR